MNFEDKVDEFISFKSKISNDLERLAHPLRRMIDGKGHNLFQLVENIKEKKDFFDKKGMGHLVNNDHRDNLYLINGIDISLLFFFEIASSLPSVNIYRYVLPNRNLSDLNFNDVYAEETPLLSIHSSYGERLIIEQHRNRELTDKHKGKRISVKWIKDFLEYHKSDLLIDLIKNVIPHEEEAVYAEKKELRKKNRKLRKLKRQGFLKKEYEEWEKQKEEADKLAKLRSQTRKEEKEREDKKRKVNIIKEQELRTQIAIEDEKKKDKSLQIATEAAIKKAKSEFKSHVICKICNGDGGVKRECRGCDGTGFSKFSN